MALERLPRRAMEKRIKSRKRPLALERPKLRDIHQIRENLQAKGVEWTTILNEEY